MKQQTRELIQSSIRAIADYPKPGIIFRDITSLVEDAAAFKATIDELVAHYKDAGIDKVVGTEARGFIFGAPVAAELGVGFVPVRKPGKLPREVIEESYELEYGQDTLQMHKDAISEGDKVLIVDDLLATGGTAEAAVHLVRRRGGLVHDAAFVISLCDLPGEKKLQALDINVCKLVEFEGE
ncbi:adenine phosphoribosyltransferase [Dongshaea marina]|uniref:adenine phosphoribosyltransferase n=1 Tax=Dongshaea marina TaxID=2047966 RepID=UPI000D3E84EE|nr:adenine phosphoribosyltransferase [Dongshaea marina]